MKKLIALSIFIYTFGLTSFAQSSPTLNDTAAIKTEIIIDHPEGLSGSTEAIAKTPVEKFESSPGSPPMATDDPGTPGKGGYEINLITNCDLNRISRDCESGIDAAIGIGERVQFRISKSYTESAASGTQSLNGKGPTDAGFKIRFYDKNGLQIATFPSYQLDDSAKHVGLDGKPIETEGRSIYLPLIVSQDFTQYTVIANVGYRKNFDHNENSSISTSVAVGKALSSTSRIMAEIATEESTSLSMRRKDVRIGWVKVIFPDESAKYQTALFTSLGRSLGGNTYSVQTGLQITRKPKN